MESQTNAVYSSTGRTSAPPVLGMGPNRNVACSTQQYGSHPYNTSAGYGTFGQRAGAYPGQGAGAYPGQGAGAYPGQGAGAYPGQGAGAYPGHGAGAYLGQERSMPVQSYYQGPYGSGTSVGYPNFGQPPSVSGVSSEQGIKVEPVCQQVPYERTDGQCCSILQRRNKTFPCRFHANGCEKTYPADLLLPHEDDCPARPLPCTYENCTWNFSTAWALGEHLASEHGEESLGVSAKVNFQVNLAWNDFKKGKISQAFGKVFYTYLFRKETNLVCLVFMCSNRRTSLYFKAKITLHGQEGTSSIAKTGPLFSLLDRDLVYADGLDSCTFRYEPMMNKAAKIKGDPWVYIEIELQHLFYK